MATVFYILTGVALLIAGGLFALVQRATALFMPAPVLEVQLAVALLIAVVCLAAGAIVSRLDTLIRER